MKRLQVQHLVKESIQEFMCIVCVYLSLGTYPFINDMIMRKKFKTKLCPMLYIIVLGSVATLSTTCCTELSFVIWPPWVRSKVGVSWRSRGLMLTLDPNAESVDPGTRTLDPVEMFFDPGAWILDPGEKFFDPGTRFLDPGASSRSPGSSWKPLRIWGVRPCWTVYGVWRWPLTDLCTWRANVNEATSSWLVEPGIQTVTSPWLSTSFTSTSFSSASLLDKISVRADLKPLAIASTLKSGCQVAKAMRLIRFLPTAVALPLLSRPSVAQCRWE